MSRVAYKLALSIAHLRLFFVLVAAGGACLAQVLLDHSESASTLVAGLALVVAAVLFSLAVTQQAVEPLATTAPALPSIPRWRRLLGLLALPCCVYAWLRLAGNRLSWDGSLAWLAAIIALLVSSYQRPTRVATHQPLLTRSGLRLDWIHLGVLAAVVIGAFLRLWRLAEIPAEMGADLPHNFNNIGQILSGQFPIYFPSWPGREGLFFYLAAIPSALLGLSHLSIKLTSALIGIATIPVIYLLGKELFEREVGLIAALLYAASHWAIITSRTGLRMVMVPLLLALTWLFWLRGLKQKRTFYLALAGLCLGLGLHTYTAFLAVPALLLVWLATEVISGRGRALWLQRWGLFYLAAVAIVVFLPLLRFSIDSPGAYLLRTATRVTSIEVPLPTQPWLTLLGNLKNSILMFNLAGDHVAFNNIVGFRELDFVAAAFLPLGAACLAISPRHGYNLSLLLTLPFMLLPSALALAFPLEVPNAGRAIGALPAAILIPSLGLNLLRRSLGGGSNERTSEPANGIQSAQPAIRRNQYHLMKRWLPWALVICLLIGETSAAFPLYFNAYRLNLPEHNYSISLAMAQVMDEFAGNGEVFIKTQGYWYDGNAVRAQLKKLQGWNNEFWELDPEQPPLLGPPGKVLVILHPADVTAVATLQTAFKHSATVAHYNYDGQVSFIAFYGER